LIGTPYGVDGVGVGVGVGVRVGVGVDVVAALPHMISSMIPTLLSELTWSLLVQVEPSVEVSKKENSPYPTSDVYEAKYHEKELLVPVAETTNQ